MVKQIKDKPDYGNWVSKRIIYLPSLLETIFLSTALLFWMLTIPAILFFLVAAYFAYARRLFSPKGGNVQKPNLGHGNFKFGLEWHRKSP